MAPQGLGANEATARMAQPFKSWNIIRPGLQSPGGPWGWIHYGIYIPHLPPPFQYLYAVAMVGTVDLAIWNHSEYVTGKRAVVQNPEHLTTVMTSTAARGNHFLRGYDANTECKLSDSGTPLRWGNEFMMNFAFPHKCAVTANFAKEGWNYQLELDISPKAVWFIATPYYEHFSLPISGKANISGETIDILGCLEYARCKPPPGLPLEIHAQVAKSTNYFIYHVLNLDDGKQILWGEARNEFVPPRKWVYVRTVPDGTLLETYTTELQVELLRDEVVKDSMGRPTRLPMEFKGRVVSAGTDVLEIIGRVNTPLRDGAGRGYVGWYDAVVKYRGEERKGWGMFEWVDLELHDKEQKANL